MDQAPRVGVADASDDAAEQDQRLVDARLVVVEPVVESGPVDELHQQAGRPFDVDHVGDRDDVGMLQRRLDLAFLDQPLAHVPAGDREHLERVTRAQGLVADAVHHRHPALAERLLDHVAVDRMPGLELHLEASDVDGGHLERARERA